MRTVCQEDPSVPFDDGSHKIILSEAEKKRCFCKFSRLPSVSGDKTCGNRPDPQAGREGPGVLRA